MDEQVKTAQHSESQQLCPQTVGVKEGQKDGHTLVQKNQLPLITKEVENIKVSSAVSVVLEGLNASLIFPQRSGGDDSVTFQLEGNKNILHPDGCKFEGSLLFSQAHPLVEALQEILRPSSGSLQIILESPNVAESTPERNVNLVGANFTSKEVINDAKNAHQSHEINGDEIVDGGAQCKRERGSVSDSSKKADSLSMVQLIHKCCYCRFRSETVALVLEHVRKKHPGKPAKTKVISGRDCPYCGLRLDQTAFFQHMRQFHEDSHPYRCGYCNFMSRDLNQLKHHWTKKHSEQPFKAFRRKASESHSTSSTQNQEKTMLPPNADTIDVDRCASKAKCETGEADGEGNVEMIESLGNTIQNCPVCHKKVKTLKYLKVHMRVHNKGRYKCGYCSYISTYCLQVLVHCKKHHQHLQPCVKEHELDPLQDKNIVKNYDMFMDEVQKKGSKQPPDPDTRKWARKYSCPSCEYTCSYGASYRRHLTIHSKSPLPFRCQYCPFEGREKYYVRRHIQRIHRGFPTVVVDNNGEPPLRIPGAMNEQFLSISTPLRNLGSHKSFTKDLVKNKKSAKKPEVSTLVNVPAVEVSVSTRTDDQVKDRMIETFMGNPGISPSSDVIIDNLGTNDRLENILGPNDCSILNVSREEEVRDGDSISPKLSEELNDHPTFSSPKSVKKQLKNHFSHQCIRDIPKVPKILPIQESVPGFSAVMKVNDSVEGDDNGVQEAVIVSHGLMPGREAGGINLVNLLNDVSTDNCESFGGQSSKERDKTDVTLFETKDAEDVKAKVGVVKTARKKGSKEKSSHKAWDFVAYRDGRYTFCVCGVRTVNKAFYKHIKKHIDSKRFGCGYCSYRSIERAKVRVHHTFVHPGLPLSVNEFEDNAKEGLDNNPLKQSLTCSNKEAISNLQSNQRKKASSSQLSPLFQCPICKKKIIYHTYTIRRHLFSHCDYRPYKCGRCDFRGCSPGEVKQHSTLHGADLCPIVQPSGQQIPEGLEQLLADCFNELQVKLGKKIRRRSKSNGKLINPIGQQMEKGLNPNGYQLVTREASIWRQSLSTGVCPWCQIKITSSENGDILSHFKGHFYKTVGDSSSSDCRFDEGGSSLPVYPSVSHEEKDTIVMNGLMYYVINQPLMKDSNDQKTSHGNQEDLFKGETGIINNPEGMPPGTIQVTDFLLADLRYLLWDHANESKLRKAQWHTCQKCKQQFRSSLALKHHSKTHINRESTGMMEEEKQYDFQKSTTHTNSQAPDGEVGVFLLGDDVEVATAVVVINSEAEEREMVLEISS